MLTFSFVAAFTALIVAGASYFLVREATIRRATDTRSREVELLLDDLAEELSEPLDADELRTVSTQLESPFAFDVLLVSPSGTQRTSPQLSTASIPPELRLETDDPGLATTRVHTDEDIFVVVGASGLDGEATLYFFFPLSGTVADLALLRRVLTVISGGVILTAGAIGWAGAANLLRPIRRAQHAAQRMEQGDLDVRLDDVGQDEFAELGRAFNGMARALRRTMDNLRDLESSHRRFVSDVSHELRTPLTALTAAADVLETSSRDLGGVDKRATRLMVGETRRLAALVEDLMEISRMDAGTASMTWEYLDVSAAVRAALAARGWTERVSVTTEGDVWTQADPRRLDSILANLVGNALTHGGPPVTVAVRGGDEGVAVAVADNGEGIPPWHVTHIFERFYKADPARSGDGSGLGLAIASENADLHGGELCVATTQGRGTTFSLFLLRKNDDDLH